MSKEEKEKHGLQDCDACIKDIKFKSGLKLFPWKSPKYKQKAKDVLLKDDILKDVTNRTISSLDESYREEYGTTFTEQLEKTFTDRVKEDGKTVRKEQKKIVKKAFENVEKQWKETADIR